MLTINSIVHNRYQLQEKLGQNLGRQTWKALDNSKSSKTPIILKLLACAPETSWEHIKLFEREANTLYHLEHPRIPKYKDYFVLEGNILWIGLVHNYVAGKSLRDLIDSGRKFSESEVRNIAISLLDILMYLHEISPAVLHRDIKPSNIILGEDKKIYLVDFGSVQARAAVKGATFTIVGTYGYTPIEQFGGQAVPASDLYALGATLVHLLTGTAPAELPQHNMRVQFQQYVSVSTDLIHWIEILTHPNVEQRFSTARQALTALESPKLVQQTYLISQKPANSRIRLSKDASQLSIKLPKRGIKGSDSLIAIWIIVLYAATIPFGLIVFPFIALYWLVGLMPVGFLLFPAFGHIELSFNRRQFTFKWKLLWLRYQIARGYTAIIHTVCENTNSTTQPSSETPTTLEIQAGAKIYQFGGVIAPISTLERQWLIFEIKEWLGLT